MTSENSLPHFESTQMRHQKARSSQLDPNYWYPIARIGDVAKPGAIHEVKFNGESIALFRTESGVLSAVENRCAHRHMVLTKGVVDKENIVCPYHGWSYDQFGKCVQIHHDLFGKPFPRAQIKTYPLKMAYGFIWIFPGEVTKAEQVKLPELFPQENSQDWVACNLDFIINAHFSIVLENSADLTHVWLHRKFMPVGEGEHIKVTHCEADEQRVVAQHTVGEVASRGLAAFLFNRKHKPKKEIHAEAVFDYPYLYVTYAATSRIIYFAVPIDAKTTWLVTFFCMDTKCATIPELLSFSWTKYLIRYIVAPLINHFYVKPIFKQDQWICAEEQKCYERHFEKPIRDLNPFTLALQRLIISRTELIK